jgi:inosine/xanthosine triphosphatase
MTSPVRLVVASRNPVKIACARGGFEKMFPHTTLEIQALEVPSGVSAQPRSSAETLQGALTRAQNARSVLPEADFWFGIEGGIEDLGAEIAAFAWVVALSTERCGKARTGAFFLPPAVADLVRQGVELGDADDIVFGQSNSKQANGAVGLLTGDALTRASFYEPAVMMALIPFKNPALYPITAEPAPSADARRFLGQSVHAVIDRPLGSRHPQNGFIYPLNYGCIPGEASGDGEALDAYVLGVYEPLETFDGECIALIQRLDEDDPKLVLAAPGVTFMDDQIRALTNFQERWFRSIILRA